MVGGSRAGLAEWYLALASCWLDTEPPLRRRLILETHGWVAERVLDPGPAACLPALADLDAGGLLERRLLALIPPDEMEAWRPWAGRVVLELRRALGRPPADRNEAWAHSLFLIPYALRSARAVDPHEPVPAAGGGRGVER